MAYALQSCVRCGSLEDGHTGPADRYLCVSCYRAGWRVMLAGGSLYRIEWYAVHTWSPERKEWETAPPKIEAPDPRTAYLAARQRHPGAIVHLARVLTEPCSPGEPVHA